MPSLLPATGAAGRDPRSFEVVLVEELLFAIRRSLFASFANDEQRIANDVDKLLTGSPLNAERTGGFRRSKQ
jgi:hypothetical protein